MFFILFWWNLGCQDELCSVVSSLTLVSWELFRGKKCCQSINEFIFISELFERFSWSISSIMHLSFFLWFVMLKKSLVDIVMLCLCRNSIISWNQILLVQFILCFDFVRIDSSTLVVSCYHSIIDWIIVLWLLLRNNFRMDWILRSCCSTY